MSESPFKFVADEEVTKIAKAYTEEIVDYARKVFKINFDFSEQSIKYVELLCEKIYEMKNKTTEETIMNYTRALGSYVGEVYIKHHGGEWGLITYDGNTFPGIRSTKQHQFWPWGRVLNRIEEGPENNVWHYYLSLTRD